MKTSRALVAAALVFATAALPAAQAFASGDDVSDGSCPVHSSNPLASFGRDLGHIFGHIGSAIATIPGLIELTGIRFPVKPYQEQVSPTFWRGSRLDDKGFADLAARGFAATVDLTKEGTGDRKLAPKHGLKTLNVKILDNDEPTEAQMLTFLDFVTNPENQPVYVHCEAGVGRTSVATAVYRMAVQGWSADDAIAEAKAHGDNITDQTDFIRRFGADLAAGKFAGYPLAPGADSQSAAR